MSSAPLTYCPKCKIYAHDESASCKAVASAYKLGQRRIGLEAAIARQMAARAA